MKDETSYPPEEDTSNQGTCVSKGCFAYKGRVKRAKPENYFSCTTDAASKKHQLEVLQNVWDNIDTELQILQSDLNTKIFDDLLKFTESRYPTFIIGGDLSDKSRLAEIPTAALITGVNTPDHAVMFSNLVTLVKERVTPLVATLRSKDCPHIKNVIGRCLSQFMENPSMELEEEEDSPNLKRLPCSLCTLAQWYQDKYKDFKPSPRKRKKGESLEKAVVNNPPLVIVFEDLESFSSHVLQDFIVICSNYLTRLPIVLVFGIATSVTAVHKLLPNSVSSLLCMEKFQAPPSTQYLTQVVDKILLTSKFPFKLGRKVFQLLLDIFLYHDFSVLNFIRGLQFCLLDHYHSNPLAYLCTDEEDVISGIKKMKSNDVDTMRQTPSFMKFVESSPTSLQKDLLLNDKVTKEEMIELVKNIFQYHTNLYTVLQCLHVLFSQLPKHLLGRQMRELYLECLKGDICDSEAFIESFSLFKLTARDELMKLLLLTIEQLNNNNLSPALQSLPADIWEFVQRFDNLDGLVDTEEETEVEDVALPKKTNLHALRKTLKEMESKKKKLTPYEKLRLEVMDFFLDLFRKHLRCPKSFTFHEIFYYDNVTEVRNHLNAAPRSSLQTALSNPQCYLQCSCCETEQGSIPATMPDVCVLYKLHLECGQLINLYDWLQAFVTIVCPDEEKPKVDQQLQARFIRAVSELQFLGFIKSTRRKTDHVARLTWGGC